MFQFHEVQLKAGQGINNVTQASPFQFHEVQLKV